MPLKKESEPITSDEWLYRRVHADRFRTDKTPFVSPGAFEPRVKGRNADTDGISLFRAACLESAHEITALVADLEKRRKIGVVKVLVAEVETLGITVLPTKFEGISGHVSLPELSADAYKDKMTKPQCKLWMNELAKLVSPEERIVIDTDPMNSRRSG